MSTDCGWKILDTLDTVDALDAGYDGVVAPSRRPLLPFLCLSSRLLDPNTGISMDPGKCRLAGTWSVTSGACIFRMSRTLSSELGWALVTRC